MEFGLEVSDPSYPKRFSRTQHRADEDQYVREMEGMSVDKVH